MIHVVRVAKGHSLRQENDLRWSWTNLV